MATGDVFKVSLLLALDAVQCRPGFYLVEGAGGGDPNPVQGAAQAALDALGSTPLTGFIQNLVYTGVHVEDIQPGTTASVTLLRPAAVPGTIADDNPPPPQDSMLISWQTGVRQIKGAYAAEGRMYMPGLYSTGQISGFLTTTLATALEVFMELLTVPFVEDGTAYQMHAVSFNPGSPRTIRAINPIVQGLARNQVAIQRRRRPGTGI